MHLYNKHAARTYLLVLILFLGTSAGSVVWCMDDMPYLSIEQFDAQLELDWDALFPGNDLLESNPTSLEWVVSSNENGERIIDNSESICTSPPSPFDQLNAGDMLTLSVSENSALSLPATKKRIWYPKYQSSGDKETNEALFRAIEDRKFSLIQSILERHPKSAYARTKRGNTVLMKILKRGHFATISYLVDTYHDHDWLARNHEKESVADLARQFLEKTARRKVPYNRRGCANEMVHRAQVTELVQKILTNCQHATKKRTFHSINNVNSE